MAGRDRQELHVLLYGGTIAGFVGEFDLNAIDPASQGQGGGRFMCKFALARLKVLGVRIARVGTGLDSNHAAARTAYKAIGFERSLSWTVLYKLI